MPATSLIFQPAPEVPELTEVEQQVANALRFLAANSSFMFETELTCGITVSVNELPLFTGDADYAYAAKAIVARKGAAA